MMNGWRQGKKSQTLSFPFPLLHFSICPSNHACPFSLFYSLLSLWVSTLSHVLSGWSTCPLFFLQLQHDYFFNMTVRFQSRCSTSRSRLRLTAIQSALKYYCTNASTSLFLSIDSFITSNRERERLYYIVRNFFPMLFQPPPHPLLYMWNYTNLSLYLRRY